MPGALDLRPWLVVALATLAGAAGIAVVEASPAAAASPTTVATLNDPALSGATSVEVAGHYAYVAAYNRNAVAVVDVANPRQPRVVASVSGPSLTGPATLTVRGARLYVASMDANSLTIIDVANPTAPTILGSVSDAARMYGAYGVDVAGSFAYVAAQGCVAGRPCPDQSVGNRLLVIDIANPGAPQIVGEVHDDELLHHADSVAVAGNRAYLAAGY